MPDEPVTPVRPMLARHELRQIALDFFRVLMLCQSEPLRETDDMRVHHDPFIFMKGIPQHNVRSFAANAWQRV